MRGKLRLGLAALVSLACATTAQGEFAPLSPAAPEARVAQARVRGYWVVAKGEQLLRVSRLFTSDMREARRLARELRALNPEAFDEDGSLQLRLGARLRLPARLVRPGEPQSEPVAAAKSTFAAAALPPAVVRPPATILPAGAPPAPAVPPPRPASDERAMPFDVTINGARGGTWVFVERGGEFHAPREAFEEWRIELDPHSKPIDFKGLPYWPLSGIPGFKAKVDFATQSLELLFSPQAFTALRLTTEITKRQPLSPALPSAFLNYDLNVAGTRPRGASALHDIGAVTEVGVSGSWGVLTSTQVARNLAGEKTLGPSRQFLRLETTLTRDFPDRNRTLKVGDAITRAGLWGRNVYFGGIQYGSNFALSPGFITQPLPTLRGTSAAPSTVELYINDVLRQVSSVPTGPFTIDNFPVMTGNGDARIVVRDLLGRETVLEQSFFSSNRLLAKGLDDWSVEAGTERRDLGSASNDYGRGFASGLWRHGYSDELTLEGRMEVSRALRSIGLGVSTVLPLRAVGTAACVASDHDEAGRGSLWHLGLEREGLRNSFQFQAQGATSRFRLLGQPDAAAPVKLQVAGNWTYFTERWGSFGLGFASLSRHDQSRVTTVSGNVSLSLGGHSTLMLTASRGVAGDSGNAVGLMYVMPLDNSRAVGASASTRNGRRDAYLSAQQNPTSATDLGWRLLAGQVQDEAKVEAGAYYQWRYGTLNSELSATSDIQALRLGVSGGVVAADGRVFATRRVDDSFAVVEVPGYGDVGIGVGSNMLARTDAAGVALIPRLWPYQRNSIRLNPNELPLSAEIDSIEEIVVPGWRTGVKVKFPVRTGRGALLKIVLEDGEVAPAGAVARIAGEKEEFYVARRGEAFVTGLRASNRVILAWKGKECLIEVVLPPEVPDEFARVGPLVCKGVAR